MLLYIRSIPGSSADPTLFDSNYHPEACLLVSSVTQLLNLAKKQVRSECSIHTKLFPSLILHQGQSQPLINARFLKYTGWVIGHSVCVLCVMSLSHWSTDKHVHRFPILVSAVHKPYSSDYPLALAVHIWHGQKHLLCELQPRKWLQKSFHFNLF